MEDGSKEKVIMNKNELLQYAKLMFVFNIFKIIIQLYYFTLFSSPFTHLLIVHSLTPQNSLISCQEKPFSHNFLIYQGVSSLVIVFLGLIVSITSSSKGFSNLISSSISNFWIF